MVDTGVYIHAARLLDKLVNELANTRAGEPATSTMHAGTMVPDYGQHFDGDLEGFCTVRVVDIAPTVQFPSPVNKPIRTTDPALELSVTFEMTVTRCYGHPEDNGMPPVGQLDSNTRDILDDAAAMRRAAQYTFRNLLPGVWRPRAQQGGVHGGTMTVTVPIPGYCGDELLPAALDEQVLPVDGDPRFR